MKVIFPICIIICISCKTSHRTVQIADKSPSEIRSDFVAVKPLLVYKTKANYNNLVPVILSDDKSEIVFYPHPSDIKTESGYQTPIPLYNGYLLDQRGIGKNVAFLNVTYEDYAKLKEVPTIKELYNLIFDNSPLVELCNCGSKKSLPDLVNQLNELIDSNKLKTKCKVIK